MVFVFHLDGGRQEAFVSTDPMFAHLEGYQENFDWFTEELFNKMKRKGVEKSGEEDDTAYKADDCEEMISFLYNFTACMEDCEHGQYASAFASFYVIP